MTDEESASIVFDDQLSEAEDADLEEFSNFADRLYDFEVSKTNEQAEAVDLREGFEVRNSLNTLSGRDIAYLPPQDQPTTFSRRGRLEIPRRRAKWPVGYPPSCGRRDISSGHVLAANSCFHENQANLQRTIHPYPPPGFL